MEIVTRTGELSYFLQSAAAGAAAVLLYDFLRARRRVGKHPSLFRVICEDTLFFMLMGLLIYALAVYGHGGKVRWYSFLGMLLGGLMLKLSVGDLDMRLLEKLYIFAVSAVCFSAKILLFPLSLICRITRRPIGVVVWHSKEGSREIEKILRSIKAMIKMRIKK